MRDGGEPAALDPERLAILQRSGIPDSPPEEAFDRFTRLAAGILDAPVSLASFVDAERQFFKSCHGVIAEPWHSERETPLSHSFCQHVVNTGAPLVVEDAREHPVVRNNLAIADLGVVAYAGVPIRAPSGHVLGSFCVIDTRKREWTEQHLSLLEDLAAAVSTEIALRLEITRQREAEGRLVLETDLETEQREHLETVWTSGSALLRVIDDGSTSPWGSCGATPTGWCSGFVSVTPGSESRKTGGRPSSNRSRRPTRPRRAGSAGAASASPSAESSWR